MNEDDLQQVWGRQGNQPKTSLEEIQSVLRPDARRNSRGLLCMLFVYVAVIAITLIVEGMSLYGVRTNGALVMMQMTVIIVTLTFLFYGVYLISDLASMDRVDQPLTEVIRRRLRFCRTKYEIWLWMLAFTLLFLTESLAIMRHNVDGRGQVDRSLDVMDGFMAVLFVIAAYAIMKIGSYPLVREIKAIASDLDQQATTGTEQVRQRRKIWRVIGGVLAVLGTGLLVIVVLKNLGWLG